jgi:hypothetical protein
MRKALPFILALALCQPLFATTLKEMHDAASPGSGYDRYIVLETGVTYTGGLLIGGTFNRITAQFEPGGEDVRIAGHGAILDLEGAEICLSYCSNRLDIDDCVIINGNIRFHGYQDSSTDHWPAGFVRHVTFYKPHDYAVRMLSSGRNIEVDHNIAVDVEDTGWDFLPFNGTSNDWLPTGIAVAMSELPGGLDTPDVSDNWTWFSDPAANGTALRHFALLCDYG